MMAKNVIKYWFYNRMSLRNQYKVANPYVIIHLNDLQVATSIQLSKLIVFIFTYLSASKICYQHNTILIEYVHLKMK